MTEIDWARLREAAREAMQRAYAPYSNFPVGAAALTDDGRVITGCNVENASYGLGLCAECSLVSALYGPDLPAGSRRPRLVALSVVDGNGDPLMPCGRCRQLLWEHGGPHLLLATARGIVPMSQVLPDAFGPDDLTRLA
ncbi:MULTISPECIES: cytidine deaminase [Thermomonospora]|uniref:Cytidine deaminase n=1 Tax=Thermomonospora curvata (strain ATCC 19995 / DSM 43183 / JCM 3096 / KCTC 9072 / NBRC 15933 / NCIMB 10081 / Henssen B9) TaxID=471852 RepID=D1A264_THECD|nr:MULTISPECIES: cytidine deaminase [Thermomonospora]ACY99717.1 cytidine deaminase [Thermomonospora curvata DSM 43183]PKK12730.1 MAG: cytidine deaminase [Thermomonospora sp. CIF 1]